MKQYKMTSAEFDQAKSPFGEHQMARTLMASKAAASITAGQLLAYVKGAEDDHIEERLKTDFTLFRTYKMLLKQSAQNYIPMAIAASSDDYPKRDLEGCIVRIQEARADSEELYLIIEFKDKSTSLPKTLHLSLEEGTTARLELPVGRNGIIQTIISKTSDVATLFKNPKTELYLT